MNGTHEIEACDLVPEGHADPSQFDILKVLGQGSFGKVSIFKYLVVLNGKIEANLYKKCKENNYCCTY